MNFFFWSIISIIVNGGDDRNHIKFRLYGVIFVWKYQFLVVLMARWVYWFQKTKFPMRVMKFSIIGLKIDKFKFKFDAISEIDQYSMWINGLIFIKKITLLLHTQTPPNERNNHDDMHSIQSNGNKVREINCENKHNGSAHFFYHNEVSASCRCAISTKFIIDLHCVK